MKNRIACSITGALLMAASSVHAATYVPSFDGLGNGAILVPTGTGPGFDGWTQSEANPAADSPLSYGQGVNGYPGVAIGGRYATPTLAAGYISHTVALPFGGSAVALGLTVGRFDGFDPDPQNGFEIGAYDSGGANLFSFVLEPTIDPDKWNMAYRSGAGPNVAIFSSFSFALDQISSLSLNFTANGLTTDFGLSLSTLGTTLSTSGNLAVDPTTTFDNLRISILKVTGTDPIANPFDAYGTNFIAIVPEPTSVMLLGLTAGLGLIRRRRA